jgi:hypothetical protein
MHGPRKIRIRLIAFALGAGALLVPITVSGGSVRPNDACAAGACCLEPGSVCEAGGEVQMDHAFTTGVCPNVDR